MKIVVLCGGLSTERDVSIITGNLVYEALVRQGEDAILLDVFSGIEGEVDSDELFRTHARLVDGVINETEPDIPAIRAARGDSDMGDIGPNVLKLCRQADIVYMGLHGENGENGKLQALFDIVGICYTGSGYLGSAIAMNKGTSKQLLQASGVPTPRGIVFRKEQMADVERFFRPPCVVKPCSGGSSIGVVIVNEGDDLKAALAEAFRYEDEVLVEEYVKGREFSVGVLGDRVLPPIEIIPKGAFYDYAHKYQKGYTREVCPPENLDDALYKAMQENALVVSRILGLEVYSRIDFMMDSQDRIYCLEANTLPGMTPTSLLPQEAQAVGISYDELVMDIVKRSLALRRR